MSASRGKRDIAYLRLLVLARCPEISSGDLDDLWSFTDSDPVSIEIAAATDAVIEAFEERLEALKRDLQR